MKKIAIYLVILCFLWGAGSVLAAVNEPPSSLPIWKKTFSTDESREIFISQLEKNEALVEGQIIRKKLDVFIFVSAKKRGYDKYVGEVHRVNQHVYAKAFWGWNGMLSNGAKGDLPETISLKKLFAKHKRTGLYYPMHIGVYADLRRYQRQILSLKGETTAVKAKQKEVNAFVEVARNALESGEFTQAMKDGFKAEMDYYFNQAFQDIADLKDAVTVAGQEREKINSRLNGIDNSVNVVNTKMDGINSRLTGLENQVTEVQKEVTSSKFWTNAAVTAVVVILLLLLFWGHLLKKWAKSTFATKSDLGDISDEVEEQGQDLESLSNAFSPQFDFDTSLITEDKLKELPLGEAIVLPLTSTEDDSVVRLRIEKTADDRIVIFGAVRQIGEIQPLMLDSLARVPRAINRAVSQNRIVGTKVIAARAVAS